MRSTLTRFATAICDRFPQATELSFVTRQMALEFMEAESKRKVTPKTWNDVLMLLRTACNISCRRQYQSVLEHAYA